MPEPGDFTDVGLRTYERIAELWGLSNSERARLLALDEASYHAVQEQSATPPESALRCISYVLGIYRALQVLFPDPTRADRWIKRPNRASGLAGRTALERMLEGEQGLAWVHAYLEGQIHG